MRVPLTLLVAGCNSFDVQAAEFFDTLGARALPVPSQFLSQALFSPKLVVDALVVDATTVAFLPGMILPLGDVPIRAAEMLVKELLRLSPSQRMPNGVPWKHIPHVVLVDEHNYDAFHAHCRHHAHPSWSTRFRLGITPGPINRAFQLAGTACTVSLSAPFRIGRLNSSNGIGRKDGFLRKARARVKSTNRRRTTSTRVACRQPRSYFPAPLALVTAQG